MQTDTTLDKSILVVDDDPSILEVLAARLEGGGFSVRRSSSAEEGLKLLAAEPVSLVISDVKMPGMGGLGLLAEVRDKHPKLPVILLTAYGSIPDAVSAVRDGATDYMTKPFDGDELLTKVRAVVDAPRESRSKTALVPAPGRQPVDRRVWGGRSPAMARVFQMVERVAPTDVTVLITGESGTGKEKISRIIHERSQRANGPFVVVDCGSTPTTLLESELFGHVKGAFTHAVKDKRGLIEAAHGGTLLLDEIGNISPEMQTRLLRFLQERTIRRIGDTREIEVDCRVLAATNADLPSQVREGAFREDLYFRLKVIAMQMPALRERKEDIPDLARRFCEAFARTHGNGHVDLTEEAVQAMVEYPWPGNVRELKHVMEAAVVLSPNGVIRAADLQFEDGLCEDFEFEHDDCEGALSLEESERRAIIHALREANWIQKDAADILGISRRAIHYKVKKYDIDVRAHKYS